MAVDQLVLPGAQMQQMQMVRAPCGTMPTAPLAQMPRSVTPPPPPARAAVLRAASCERGSNVRDLRKRNATPPPYLSGSVKAPVTSWPGAAAVDNSRDTGQEMAEMRRQLQQMRRAIDCDVLEAFRRMRRQTGDLSAKVDFIMRSHPVGELDGSASSNPAAPASSSAPSPSEAASAQGVSEHRFQKLDARVAELAADGRGLGDACQADRRRLERMDLLVADMCHNGTSLLLSGSTATLPEGRTLAPESRQSIEALLREHRRDVELRFAGIETRLGDLMATLVKGALPESLLQELRAEVSRAAVGNAAEARKSRAGQKAATSGGASVGSSCQGRSNGCTADRSELIEEKASEDLRDLMAGEQLLQEKVGQKRDVHEKSERALRSSAIQARRSASTGALAHPARASFAEGSPQAAAIPRGGSESPPRGPAGGSRDKKDRPVSFGFDDLARSADADSSSPSKPRTRRATPWVASAPAPPAEDESEDSAEALDESAAEPAVADSPSPSSSRPETSKSPSRLRQPRGSTGGVAARRPPSGAVRCRSSDTMGGSTASITHLNAVF